MQGKIKALRKKLRTVSGSEKAKLICKLFLRLIGIRKCLFLGGYREEEDERQSQEDSRVYHALLEIGIEKNRKSEKTGCWSTYVALMTETLDTGGLEEVVKLLAEEYRKRSVPIQVFCAKEGGCVAKQLEKEGIEVHIFHGNPKLFQDYVKKAPPQLINTHYVNSFMEEIAQMGIPIVEVIHNMYVFCTHKQLLRENKKAQYISQYIAVSQLAKDIYRIKVPAALEKEITVIGNAGKTLQNTSADSRVVLRRQLKIRDDDFVLLSVGNIDPRKNQLGIVRAWSIVQKLRPDSGQLLLAGKESDIHYTEKVKEIIHRRDLDNKVRILGQRNDIEQLLDAADAVIIDSYYEGWSMAATEALCKGVPLIHSFCGSGTELIANGHNGYLTGMPLKKIVSMDNVELYDAMCAGLNDNMQETVKAILRIMDEKAIWRVKKDEIKRYAEAHFSTNEMVEAYLDVYKKLV